MKFWKLGLAVSTILSLAAVAAPANAASITYDWTVSAFGTSGEIPPGLGTITVTQETSGKDEITGITGEIGGIQLTGITGATGFLYPNGTPTPLDTTGFSFTTLNGSTAGTGSIFSFQAQNSIPSPESVNLDGFSGFGGFLVGNFNITPVPLPASWIMMVAGLCGFGFVARRGSKNQAV